MKKISSISIFSGSVTLIFEDGSMKKMEDLDKNISYVFGVSDAGYVTSDGSYCAADFKR